MERIGELMKPTRTDKLLLKLMDLTMDVWNGLVNIVGNGCTGLELLGVIEVDII
jgi:hypothetical protein